MVIDYELTTEDVMQFRMYYYDHSPRQLNIRKLRKLSLIFSIFVAVFAAVVLLVVFNKQFITFIWILCGVALLAFIYLIVSPLLLRKTFKRTVVKAYSREKNKLTGKHKVSIYTDGITDITDTRESITPWNAIEWVSSTDHYLFMVAIGSGPYIIPIRAFADEQAFKQFIDTIKAYHQAAEVDNDN